MRQKHDFMDFFVCRHVDSKFKIPRNGLDKKLICNFFSQKIYNIISTNSIKEAA